MFAWLKMILIGRPVKSTDWVLTLLKINSSGSYKDFKKYYDKHVTLIHTKYLSDFVRFERYAKKNYKKDDQKIFMAIKTAMYAQKSKKVKVAACITASIISFNRDKIAKNKPQIHPRLQKAALAIHKQLVMSQKSSTPEKKTEELW
ncbi:hypothetical protein [Veronia pacifica]|uniref:Uncharacterized protein n=1 Tax=Veronia pacifica TaxID=1080227 RepID=A0A1C3EQX9_9GAMM|nr:hypothetical protein [Veronia pacifica]ODA35653.1 hypothetical protein A8L45_03300 [Veronia pacifica]